MRCSQDCLSGSSGCIWDNFRAGKYHKYSEIDQCWNDVTLSAFVSNISLPSSSWKSYRHGYLFLSKADIVALNLITAEALARPLKWILSKQISLHTGMSSSSSLTHCDWTLFFFCSQPGVCREHGGAWRGHRRHPEPSQLHLPTHTGRSSLNAFMLSSWTFH